VRKLEMMAVTTGIATGRMAVAIRPWSGRVGSGQTGYALAISLDCEVIADNESALALSRRALSGPSGIMSSVADGLVGLTAWRNSRMTGMRTSF